MPYYNLGEVVRNMYATVNHMYVCALYLGLIVLHADSFFYAGLWKPRLIFSNGSLKNYVYKRRG